MDTGSPKSETVERASSLFNLPNELLIMIFESVNENHQVALVCKKFQDIITNMESKSKILVIRDEKTVSNQVATGRSSDPVRSNREFDEFSFFFMHIQLSDAQMFGTIIATSREFDYIKINLTNQMTALCWERLRKILERFDFRVLSINNFDPRPDPQLHLLEILTELPENSLTEIKLVNLNLKIFAPFFLKQQQSVKKFSVTGPIGDKEILSSIQHFHLESLKMIAPKTKQLSSIIRHQKDLRSLKLTIDSVTEYNNEVFNEIVELEHLEALDIPFNENLSPVIIKNLQAITNLQKLSLSCSLIFFGNLTHAHLPSLKEIDVTISEPIFNEMIKNLSKNVPNLTSVKLKGPLVINFITEIASKYKDLENLWIENDESFYVNIPNLQPIERVNESLKHFCVINHDRKVVLCTNDLINFLKMFPRMETLVLSKFVEFQLNNLEAILLHLPELKELIIEAKNLDSTTKVMNAIKLSGKNLKFIKFENCRMQTDVDSLKVFFEGKFPVIEKAFQSLTLRQHRKSFIEKTSI